MFRDVPGCSGMFRAVPECSMFPVLSTTHKSTVERLLKRNFQELISVLE